MIIKALCLATFVFFMSTISLGDTVIVSQRSDNVKGKAYKYAITNKMGDDAVYINFGESCRIGQLLQVTEKKIDNERVAIVDDKGNWLPNMEPISGITGSVEMDNRIGLAAIHLEGAGTGPILQKMTTKTFEFYVKEGASDVMLNLPICIYAGATEEHSSLIASEPEWKVVDEGFNVSKAEDECVAANTLIKPVDPYQGDSRYQCTDKKFSLLEIQKRIQFLCVLEKRLQRRVLGVYLNTEVAKLEDAAKDNPKNLGLAKKAANKKEKLLAGLQKAIKSKQDAIVSLKSKQENLYASIDSICKK